MKEQLDLGVFESQNEGGIPSAPPDPFYYNGLNLIGSAPGQLVPTLEPQMEQYGKVRMDNCQETVLGTKIMADNVNIIVSNDKRMKLHQNIKQWGKNENEENGLPSEDQKEHKCCWKRALYVAIGLAAILVVGIVIWWVSISVSSKSGGTVVSSTTTLSPGTRTTTSTPPTLPPGTTRTTTSTPPPASSTQKPADKWVSRSEWKGMEPSRKYLRTYGYPIDFIALDNFGTSHCANISACSVKLQMAEKEAGESLNYDFLIDDSGNIYEARGWKFLSDWKYNIDTYPKVLADRTVKVAFIGDYHSLPLTTKQYQSFMLVLNSKMANVSTVETQAYRGIPGENGPSKNVYCGIQHLLAWFKVQIDQSNQSSC